MPSSPSGSEVAAPAQTFPMHDSIVRLGIALGAAERVPAFARVLEANGESASATSALYRQVYRVELPTVPPETLSEILDFICDSAKQALHPHALWEIGMEASALMALSIRSLVNSEDRLKRPGTSEASTVPLPMDCLKSIIGLETSAPILSCDGVRNALLVALRHCLPLSVSNEFWRANATFCTMVLLRMSGVVSAGETSGRRMLAAPAARDIIIDILETAARWPQECAPQRQMACNRVLTTIRNIVRGPAGSDHGTYCNERMRDVLLHLLKKSMTEDNGTLLPHIVKTIQRILESRYMDPVLRRPFTSATVAQGIKLAICGRYERVTGTNRMALEVAVAETTYRVLYAVTILQDSLSDSDKDALTTDFVPDLLAEYANHATDKAAVKRLMEGFAGALGNPNIRAKLAPRMADVACKDLCVKLAVNFQNEHDTLAAVTHLIAIIIRCQHASAQNTWRQWLADDGTFQVACSMHSDMPSRDHAAIFGTEETTMLGSEGAMDPSPDRGESLARAGSDNDDDG